MSVLVTAFLREDTRRAIDAACDELKALLLAKNDSYGDSALTPIRVFSRADALEQLAVRLDDKITRLQRVGAEALGEDTLLDLLGYGVLYLIQWRRLRVAHGAPPTSPDLAARLDAARGRS